MNKNLIIISIIILIVIIAGIYFFMNSNNQQNPKINTAALSNSQPAQPSETPAPSNFDIQGMKVEVLQQGTGEGAKSGDLVTVNYTGTLTNGTKFDSSLNPGRTPFQFTLGQNRVIQGWELGVLGMKPGEKRKLTIPPELAYGAQSPSPLIPANSTLVFEIDLLKIN